MSSPQQLENCHYYSLVLEILANVCKPLRCIHHFVHKYWFIVTCRKQKQSIKLLHFFITQEWQSSEFYDPSFETTHMCVHFDSLRT